MTNVEVIEIAPHGFSRIRCGKAEGLGRQIGGVWRAFGWWSGVESKTLVGVENERVPPRGGKRRPVTDKLLPALPGMSDRQLAGKFAHSYIFHDPAVARLLVSDPELAARCLRAASSNPSFAAAIDILRQIGTPALPVILEGLAKSGHRPNAPSLALALADIDPSALPEAAEASLVQHMAPSGSLETWAVLRYEALLLAMPASQRARVLEGFNPKRFGTVLYASPRMRAESGVAARILEALLGRDDTGIKYVMKDRSLCVRSIVRDLAPRIPQDVVAALADAKGPRLELVAHGAAAISTPEAAKACVAVIDKPGVAFALQRQVRHNEALRDAVQAVARTGKGKKKAYAIEVLHALPRDADVAAADAALAELLARSPEVATDARRLMTTGQLEDWVAVEAYAANHGVEFFAVLAAEITRLIAQGHRRCNLGRWPADLGTMILSRVGDEHPVVTHAVRTMLVAWGYETVSGETLSLLSDRIVASGFSQPDTIVKWYAQQQSSGATVATFIPLLELMRVGNAKFKSKVADTLVAFGGEIVEALGPYLCWPSYADVAADVARRIGDARWVEPLRAALATKPLKKTRVALQAALDACEAAGARGSTVDSARNAKVVGITTPPTIEGLHAALEALGKTRRKLPEPGLVMQWRTGAALGEAAARGLWAMLTAAQQCVPTALMRDIRDALTPTMRDAIVDAALGIQAISGKKKEVWSLNALALLATEARIAHLCDHVVRISSGSHALAKHTIEALRQREEGRAILALDRLSRVGGKRAELAEEALDGLVRLRQIDRHEMIDLGFTGVATDRDHLQAATARLESAMIVARPFRAAHLQALLASHPVFRRAAAGLMIHQGGRRLWLNAEAEPVDDDGTTVKLGDQAIVIVHPAALTPEAHDDAIAIATRQGLRPRVEQLSRPVARTSQDALEARVKAQRKTKYRDLWQRVGARGYGEGEYLPDSNAVMSFVRRLGHGVEIELYHDGGYEPRRIEDLLWGTTFHTSDAGLLSEIALDLDVILKPPAPRKVAPSVLVLEIDDEYPHAQVSPSGRAKCVHCAEKIAKGDTRVVVERTVEIDGDMRRVNGYLHLQCAEPCAEAAGLDPAAFMQAMRDNSEDGALTTPA